MQFVTTNLPNNGKTAHFAVSYDGGLSKADGLDQALDLLNHCEDDLALICSWFPGITFTFDFPIGVQITGQSGGATWSTSNPTVTIKPGPSPPTGIIRYLLVMEVTEMYMASQQKQWFEASSSHGADEGSMGESLSRFLASEFLKITSISPIIYPGFTVANIWLNDLSRPDVIDIAPDDIKPDATTGGGTCFLFYLKYQLGHTIQDIIANAADTLGGVYTKLTGKTNGWTSFKTLVDSHYPPPTDGGLHYFPPLDNVFPVAELIDFAVPSTLSWVENDPNVAVLVLSPNIPVNVEVTLTSRDPASIGLPASVLMNSTAQVSLNVPIQPAGFVSKVVTLKASYAGQEIIKTVTVVRPEDLPVTPLEIKVVGQDDPCLPHFVEGNSVSFYIANPFVVHDHTGLTYKWTVTGAAAPITNEAALDIPSLPAAGTQVTVQATITNADGIHSTGTFTFTTTPKQTIKDVIREFQCQLGQIKAINTHIPPWVPIEAGEIFPPTEQLVNIEQRAEQMTVVARRVVASVKAIIAEKDA